ncbi:site-2 protease family protein [Candidatus Saccharibacteria bacterium]|nr:site-2 protease family protein [Candidatus Saccharibacteria bacterium]
MNIFIGVIVGFFILMLLVVAHEFGHFIVARRNGVTVEEFGIGFPPRAIAWVKNPEYEKWKKTGKIGKKPKKWLRLPKTEWGKKQKTLIFSLNWLPIGGFCSMKGESDSDTAPHSFGAASLWAKTKILFAGVTMNWLVAFIILTILAFTGMPTFMDNQFMIESDSISQSGIVKVTDVIEDSPAKSAGLQKDDEILKIGEYTIYSTSDLAVYNHIYAGESVDYQVKRGDKELTLPVKLNGKDAEYLLGITMTQESMPTTRHTWSAPLVAAVNTVQLTGETYRGLGNMVGSFFSGIFKQFSGDEAVRTKGQQEIKAAGDSVSGPVGIIGVLFPNSVESGPTTLAFLAAIISISLACMNVLPIPALDGGRFFLIMLYRIRGKKLTKETEERIVSRAFIFLLILIVLVTILDVTRFF